MNRYSLSLPLNLKKEAEDWAKKQNVSLNKFIMWAVAEKVGSLKQNLDDPDFPHITYRRGAAGIPVPVIRGTGLRVQTIVIAAQQWGMEAGKIAEEYDLKSQNSTWMRMRPVNPSIKLFWVKGMMLPEPLISGCLVMPLMNANCWELPPRDAVF